MPETNRASRVYNVAAVLYLQCAMCNVISSLQYVVYFYISTFRSMCAVPNAAVFYSSSISCFPDMLLRYCLSDCEMVPVAHVIAGITFAFTFHICGISVTRSLNFNIFSALLLLLLLNHYLQKRLW